MSILRKEDKDEDNNMSTLQEEHKHNKVLNL